MSVYEHDYYKTNEALAAEHDACGIGMVVNIDGRREYRTLDDALSIVEKLEHRAGKDAAGEVGDGVGILLQISHGFFKKAAADAGITIGEAGDYGVGMFFLPRDLRKRTFAMRLFQVNCEKNGLKILGWREVPTNPAILGKKALDCMPYIGQCFIERPEDCSRGIDFDRRLYVCRREFEQSAEDTYINSLSSRTIEQPLPWCIPASPPTPPLPGNGPIRTVLLRITARSIPFAETMTACWRVKKLFIPPGWTKMPTRLSR